MSVASFDFKAVNVLVGGVPITGFDTGAAAISVERNKDAYQLLVGADGDSTAQKEADRSGIATLRLLQTSLSNAYLTTLLKTQDAGLLSPVPFLITDSNGLDIVLAEAAYPAGPPILAFGSEHSPREWRLVLPAVDILAGGAS